VNLFWNDPITYHSIKSNQVYSTRVTSHVSSEELVSMWALTCLLLLLPTKTLLFFMTFILASLYGSYIYDQQFLLIYPTADNRTRSTLSVYYTHTFLKN
jgi:hypothetical protein